MKIPSEFSAGQRAVLVIVCLLIAGMTLFPPFVVRLPNGAVSNAGFGFLLSGPTSAFTVQPSVNLAQLLMQWIATLLVGGLAFVVQHSEGSKTNVAAATPRAEPDGQEPRAIALIVYPALRAVRALVVLVGCLQLADVLVSALKLTASNGAIDAISGNLLAMILVKFAAAGFCFLIGHGIRSLIHAMHRKWHGSPHPSLNSFWRL